MVLKSYAYKSIAILYLDHAKQKIHDVEYKNKIFRKNTHTHTRSKFKKYLIKYNL